MEFSGQYLEYQKYRLLGGTLDQTPFNLLEFEARRKIDEKTQGRLKGVNDIPNEVIMCVFALINSMSTYDSTLSSAGNKNVASESTDGYSVSYVTGSQIQEVLKSKIKEIDEIITTYLTGVVVNGQHILYLGVC